MDALPTNLEAVVTDGDISVVRQKTVGGWLVMVAHASFQHFGTTFVFDSPWQWELANFPGTIEAVVVDTGYTVKRLRVIGGWVVIILKFDVIDIEFVYDPQFNWQLA